MTIKDWTENNYQPLKQACVRISEGNPLAEELLHYVISEFLSKPEVHTIIMSGGAFFYCLRIATNSWKSSTSPFFRTYRETRLQGYPEWDSADEGEQEQEEIEYGDLLWQRAQEAMEDLGWYEKELFKMYAECGQNASLVSRLTQIPRTSINLTIKKVKKHLVKALK